MKRAVLAAVAGYVLWSFLWVGLGQGLTVAKPDLFNEDGSAAGSAVLIVFLVYSVVISMLSGIAAARISPRKPLVAARILGAVLLLTGLGVEISSWAVAPAWYHIIFLVMLLPATCSGARLTARQI